MVYREAEILLPCPRCGASLAREERGQRARCLNGCGDYFTSAGLAELLGDDPPALKSSPMWWKARATACPSCKEPMRSMELGKATLYRCAEHGAWFDAGAYPLPDVVAAARAQIVREDREQQKDDAERLGDGLVYEQVTEQRELARRLVEAERRIRLLEEQLAAVVRRLDGGHT